MISNMEIISTIFIMPPQNKISQGNAACNCWQEKEDCVARAQALRAKNYEIDLEEIATSLMKVMCICGLHPWEVKRTRELIKRSFRHFEEVRYRLDRVPKKRFGKENFLHDVAMEAGMKRMDGQLAYGIVKRAFKAYYHGTGETGRRLKSLVNKMRHRSECFWLHAAKRTAEIFAIYAGLMYSEQKQYQDCIECVYVALYKELQSRLVYENPDANDCQCGKSEEQKNQSQSELSANTILSTIHTQTTEIFFNKQKFNISNPSSPTSLHMEYTLVALEQMVPSSKLTIKRQLKTSNQTVKSGSSKTSKKKKVIKCKCPNMQCVKERRPPVITAECSQGPYICRWLPFEEEVFKEHHVPCPPMEDICPPCDFDERPCDENCTCTCELCRCPSAYDDDVEEEHAEKLSASGLEDQDTDFCWVAPFRDTPRDEEEKHMPELIEEEEEEQLEEDLPFQCRCTCEYKRRAFPHLFTYVMPFKSLEKLDAVPELQDVKPLTPKQPPCGISLATYRCWTEPSEASEETEPRNLPFLNVISAIRNPSTKVKGLTMNVTVKTQHHEQPGSKSATNQQQSRRRTAKPARSSVTVKRSTIAALEMNMKVVEEAQPKATKLPETQKSQAPTSPNKPPTAKAPAPVKPPAPEPSNGPRESEDKLIKDDILNFLGLGK